MKHLALFICLLTLLAACARETPRTDRDFGQSQASMMKQVINPTPQTESPEGLEGINAEGIMQVKGFRYRIVPPTPTYSVAK